MSKSTSLIAYETKFVTVPVVTPATPRRRSLPVKVGPWPIRRSRSEADQWRPPPSASIFGDPFESTNNERPSLREVLKKIDEECATIDRIVSEENNTTTALRDVEGSSSEDDGEKRKLAPPVSIKRARANFLSTILTLATIVIFVWPPMMAYVFGSKEWGRIMLKKEAPSLGVLGVLLAIPLLLISMSLLASIHAIEELKENRNVLYQRHKVLWLAMGGLSFGIFLDIWFLVWFLPVMWHE